MSETAPNQQWICTSCGYVYDPAEGDPDGGIPAGTEFEDIPDNWFCPVCGARKSRLRAALVQRLLAAALTQA